MSDQATPLHPNLIRCRRKFQAYEWEEATHCALQRIGTRASSALIIQNILGKWNIRVTAADVDAVRRKETTKRHNAAAKAADTRKANRDARAKAAEFDDPSGLQPPEVIAKTKNGELPSSVIRAAIKVIKKDLKEVNRAIKPMLRLKAIYEERLTQLRTELRRS